LSVLLVVCPNLAIDRVLEVDHFQSSKVQRGRLVLTQPGGKGSNVARVFRQLGGDVVVVGFVGGTNGRWVREHLERFGILTDLIDGYPAQTRTATIICDMDRQVHPTVINEESPPVEPRAFEKLRARISRWIPRVDAVLTTGSLSRGLPDHFYAEVLEHARMKGKITAIDATGHVLRVGLLAQPIFMKPNTEEFFSLTRGLCTSGFLAMPQHTTLTFGKTGAVLIHEGKCLYASPPAVPQANPIGAGDAFVAAYLTYLLNQRPAHECLSFAVATAACDVSTTPPGFIDITQLQSLNKRVEFRFL
jgi:1-phosphofructokinase family hexose kinase